MKSGLVTKLTSVLKSVMEKLSRYDEGTVFGSILGAMVRYLIMHHCTVLKGGAKVKIKIFKL